LHTGRYANLWNAHNWKGVEEELQRLKTASAKAKGLGLRVYAGHGLTYQNVKDLVRELKGYVEELNVGHSIVSNAVVFGFERAVREFLMIIQ
jgi:pyridoxine 5-phosphate synthase